MMQVIEIKAYPPASCASICKNSMRAVCVEYCAVRRDACELELKREITLRDFPLKELVRREMTLKEGRMSVAVFFVKAIDDLTSKML